LARRDFSLPPWILRTLCNRQGREVDGSNIFKYLIYKFFRYISPTHDFWIRTKALTSFD